MICILITRLAPRHKFNYSKMHTFAVPGTSCVRSAQIDDIYGRTCRDPYSSKREDLGPYGSGWNATSVSAGSPWVYQSSDQLKTATIVGRHAAYSGGGYVAELSGTTAEIQNKMADLQENGWIDRYTRVVIVELALYNPAVSLFNIVIVMFEFLGTGEIQTSHSVMTPRFFYPSAAIQIGSIISEILCIIFVIIFTVREVKRYALLRKDQSYFKDIWSYVEIVVIVLSIACIGTYIKRIVVVKDVMEEYRESQGQRYVSFYTAALWDYIVTYLSASLLVLAMIKFMRLLQFSKRVLLLSSVLRKAFPSIFAFVIFLACATTSYVILLISLLGANCEEFSTIGNCVQVLFTLALGGLKFSEEHTCASTKANLIIAPLYFMFIGTLMAIIWIPLLQSILDYVTTHVKQNAEKHLKSDMDMLLYMRRRFRLAMSCFGVPTKEEV